MKILLTGATGFVGSEILYRLLQDADNRITLLLRSNARMSYAERLNEVTKYWSRHKSISRCQIESSIEKQVRVIDWDGCEDRSVDEHLQSIDYIIHSAASTSFDLPLKLAREHNLFLTQRVIRLARRCKNLRKICFLSTAFVSGVKKGVVTESVVPLEFNNTYEQTKFEAEIAVKNSGLPYLVLRPSIIVGSSVDGYVYKLKVIYSLLRVLQVGLLKEAPIDRRARVDVVPVDFVVNSTLKLLERSAALNQVIHICTGRDAVSPVRILSDFTDIFSDVRVRVVGSWKASLFKRKPLYWCLPQSIQKALDLLFFHIPYLGEKGRMFDNSKLGLYLDDRAAECPKFEEYSTNLFKFCKESSWGKKSILGNLNTK